MTDFEKWMAENLPHIYKHREGVFLSTYNAYRRCWEAATGRPAASPSNLCMRCGAIFNKALGETCPLHEPPPPSFAA